MIMLTKIGLFLKKYWQIILLGVTAVVGLVFFRKRPTNFAEDFLKIKQIHEDEIKKVDEVKAREAELKIVAKTAHVHDVLNINAEAKIKQENLNANKEKETKRLVELEAEQLADEVSKVTGFKVITPKDE